MPQAQKRDGVFQRTDRKGWFVSFIDSNGVRCKRKVEAHTRTQALNALSALKTKAQTERVLGVKHTSDITTANLFTRYKRYQKARVHATTYERLEGIAATLEKNLPANVKDISRAKIASLITQRSEVVAPGTVQKEMTTLKHALRLAVEWELIHSNPAQGAKFPSLPQGRTSYLSPTQLKAALEAAPEWMKAPIALAAFTGMRRGELLSLRWQDVDLDGERLYLRETRNESQRVVKLNRLSVKVLNSLKRGKSSELVLAGVDGGKLSVYTRRLFASLKIKDASFHTLRHTAASWLVMEGVDLYAVGQLLGHRTPRMTQRYAHLSPTFMAGAVGKLDKVFGNVMPKPRIKSKRLLE
jgi:integrase